MSPRPESRTYDFRREYTTGSPGVSYSVSSASDCSVKTASSLPTQNFTPANYKPNPQNFLCYCPWRWQDQESYCSIQATVRHSDSTSSKRALSPSAFLDNWNRYYKSLSFLPTLKLPRSDTGYNPGVTFAGQWAYDTPCKQCATMTRHDGPTATNCKRRDRSISTERVVRPSRHAGNLRQLDHLSGYSSEIKPIPVTPTYLSATDIVMKDVSPGPEPSLASDETSLDDVPLAPRLSVRDDDLDKLALSVFNFWPEGVAFYLTHSPSSGQSSCFNGHHTSLGYSFGRSQNSNQFLNKSGKGTSFGQNDNQDQGAQPLSSLRQKKANGEPVPQWRCLYEAGQGEESLCCDHCDFTRFDSMTRHLKGHQPDQDSLMLLQRRIEDLKLIVKQSSEDACEAFAASLFDVLYPGRIIPYLRFYRLPDDRKREPFPPPARVMRQSFPQVDPSPIPPVSVQQPNQRAISPASSSFTADDSRIANTSQTPQRNDKETAAHAFSADMRRDPMLQIQVMEIKARLTASRDETDLRKRMVQSQARGKRKELQDEGLQGTSGLDERTKRTRLEEVDKEEFETVKRLNEEWLQSVTNAKRELQELHSSRTRGESSLQPKSLPQRGMASMSTPSPALINSADVDIDPPWPFIRMGGP